MITLKKYETPKLMSFYCESTDIISTSLGLFGFKFGNDATAKAGEVRTNVIEEKWHEMFGN